MTEDLDRLDVLAAAADKGYDWPTASFWEAFIDEDDGRAFDDEDVAYLAACDPATIRSLVAAVRERDELREAAGAVMLALEPEVLPRTLNRKIPVLQYDSASIARLRAALHREADQGGATDA